MMMIRAKDETYLAIVSQVDVWKLQNFVLFPTRVDFRVMQLQRFITLIDFHF